MQEHREIHEQPEEHTRMQKRLLSLLSNATSAEEAKEDSVATFTQLGLGKEEAEKLFQRVQSMIIENTEAGASLEQIEKNVLTLFKETTVNSHNLVEILDERLADRAQKIHKQVEGFLRGTEGEVLDFGAGDLQVTQLLQDANGLNIRGVDVRSYRKPGAARPVPFTEYDGKTLPFEDNNFSATLATNVLHHAGETEDRSRNTEGNEKALGELCRVTKKRIVVIETVPDPKHVEKNPKQAMERTFWNDYLYNRLFHSANVPVPGRYETREDWPRRFEAQGWHLVMQVDLGYDQPTIRDYHVLYIFEPDEGTVGTVVEATRTAAAATAQRLH